MECSNGAIVACQDNEFAQCEAQEQYVRVAAWRPNPRGAIGRGIVVVFLALLILCIFILCIDCVGPAPDKKPADAHEKAV